MRVDRIRAPIWLALPFEQGSMWQTYFGIWQEGYVSAQFPNTIHLPVILFSWQPFIVYPLLVMAPSLIKENGASFTTNADGPMLDGALYHLREATPP